MYTHIYIYTGILHLNIPSPYNPYSNIQIFKETTLKRWVPLSCTLGHYYGCDKFEFNDVSLYNP